VIVRQRVNDWGDWPDDVRERLRDWNERYLLSFTHGPDFRCQGGCARTIASHPRGNPVVRPSKKKHGAPVCEECLIAFARKFETPPALGRYAAIVKLSRKLARQETMINGLNRHNAKLKQQLRIDAIYIDELERLIPPGALAELKASLRGKHRK